MGLTSVELLIDISPMRISYSGNVIAYGYTDVHSAKKRNGPIRRAVFVFSLDYREPHDSGWRLDLRGREGSNC